jgi:hypothetical protein
MNSTETTRPVCRPRLDRHTTCVCGQETDYCRHASCPRCGHRLTDTYRRAA